MEFILSIYWTDAPVRAQTGFMETTRGTFNNPIRTFRNLIRMYQKCELSRKKRVARQRYLPQTMVPVNEEVSSRGN